MDAILDTSVIIELFGGNKRILDELKDETTVYGISVITLFELHCGTLKEREEMFLEKIPKLDFDEKKCKVCRQDLQRFKIKMKDSKG